MSLRVAERSKEYTRGEKKTSGPGKKKGGGKEISKKLAKGSAFILGAIREESANQRKRGGLEWLRTWSKQSKRWEFVVGSKSFTERFLREEGPRWKKQRF